MKQRIALAPVLIASALMLAACGDDDSAATTSAAPNTEPATTLTVTTDSAPDSTTGASDVAGSSDFEQMEASLAILVDRSRTAAEIVAEVVGGEDLEPAMVELLGVLNEGDGFQVDLNLQDDVTITGDEAAGFVEIVSNGSPFPDLYPAFFTRVDGVFHVNRIGACSLLSSTGISCPEA